METNGCAKTMEKTHATLVAALAENPPQAWSGPPSLTIPQICSAISFLNRYFHDGRYATLEALLDDNLDRMGSTSQLKGEDREALLAFLRTL